MCVCVCVCGVCLCAYVLCIKPHLIQPCVWYSELYIYVNGLLSLLLNFFPRPKAFSVVAKCSDDTNPDIVNPSLVYHGMPLLSYNNGVSQTS